MFLLLLLFFGVCSKKQIICRKTESSKLSVKNFQLDIWFELWLLLLLSSSSSQTYVCANAHIHVKIEWLLTQSNGKTEICIEMCKKWTFRMYQLVIYMHRRSIVCSKWTNFVQALWCRIHYWHSYPLTMQAYSLMHCILWFCIGVGEKSATVKRMN